MTDSPETAKRDRLAAFFATFELEVSVVRTDEIDRVANLAVVGDDGRAASVVFAARGDAACGLPDEVLAAARVEFGGLTNPLVGALPERFEVLLDGQPLLRPVVEAFVAEAGGTRCGRQVALDRLCEVIVLFVLRQAIDGGATGPGLLAGLSHPMLHRAIVAMHDEPGRPWLVEDLARIAGMSRSRFIDQFRLLVGTTPGAYLEHWRLTLARRELLRGGRVKSVARLVGFGSAAAFSRAYSRVFGHPPALAREQEATAG
ncbi:MAG: AraC family transcriptional regulator [Hyphomicrobiales bacterium]